MSKDAVVAAAAGVCLVSVRRRCGGGRGGETTTSTVVTAVDGITGGGTSTSTLASAAAASGEAATMTTKCRASEEESAGLGPSGSDRGGGESDDVDGHDEHSIMFDGAVVTWGILPLLRRVLNQRGNRRGGGTDDLVLDQCSGGDDVVDNGSVQVLLTTFGGTPGLNLDVPHLRQPDGWSCGYRNLQMLMCHLIISGDDLLGDDLIRRAVVGDEVCSDDVGGSGPEDGIRLEVAAAEDFEKAGEDSSLPATAPPSTLPRNLPTVLELQRLLEGAWSEGYDPDGAQHYNHRLISTKKRIGAVEVTSLLRYLGVDATVVQFVKTAEGRAVLAPFVWNHFACTANPLPSSSSSLPHSGDRSRFDGGDATADGRGCKCGCSRERESEVEGGGCGDDDCGGIIGHVEDEGHKDLSAGELLRLTQDLGAIDVDVEDVIPPGCRTRDRHRPQPPPLYLQWAGHSVTVVGIVRRRRMRRSRGSTPRRLRRTPSGECGGDDTTESPPGAERADGAVTSDFDFDLIVFDPLRDCSGLRSRLSSSLASESSLKKEGAGEGDDEGEEDDRTIASSVAPTMITRDHEEITSSSLLSSPLRLPAESLLRRDCQIVHCRRSRRRRRRCGCRCQRREPESLSSSPDGLVGGDGTNSSSCSSSSSSPRSQPPMRKRRRRPPEEELDPRKRPSSSSSSPPTTSPSDVDAWTNDGGRYDGGDDRDNDGEEGEKAGVSTCSSGSGDIVIKGVRSVTATGIRMRR